MPVGPSVAVMPGANKPFDIFMQDDQLCRSWASHAIGLPGHDAAAARMLASTLAAATIGALATATAHSALTGPGERHLARASSSTSTQCITGVAVPVCRCWIHPILALTMACGANAARWPSLRSRNW